MRPRPVLIALVLALSACATDGPRTVTDTARPHAVGEGSAVSVSWGDPAQFAELRYSQNRRLAAQGDWVVELADYMQERLAKAVPAGERVDVEILDIQRAGEYEWLRSQTDDVRVLRDVYPPRMTLQFSRKDADGNVISEGERKISDLAYLQSPPPFSSSDSLRYEKRMIDSWIRREF
ncbi:Membrane protein [Lysobacter dokdonensis DS-58]|uniref:Membrane protein n=1 Tax=Lysobacter dokdonensis DS-58 TaxID=1300345 RepID=A0A0A2WYR1_9GAMM|nr:DUF3016 domain-containing protein [Lysobacter dokdonensis]KGQ18114.1 Membrane protein [Lysobacter dokdonensis DS-58]